MKSLTKHTQNLGRVVTLLFFVANTGFTAVVDYCSNDGAASCAMESCAENRDCDAKCDQTLPFEAELASQVPGDCDNVAVAGGLNSTPMVLETILGAQTSKIDVLSCVSPQSVVLPGALRIIVFSSSSPSGVALQHTVEKYILNASFLI
jgi:hypothetical protein